MKSTKELIQEKAQVWILSKFDNRELRVLLLKTLPERGAFWQPVTGKVEPGETIQKGALREAIEETGLAPLRSIESLGMDFTFDGKWGPTHETVFYFETYPGCPAATLDKKEHSEFVWLPLDEAHSRIHYEANRKAFTKLLQTMGRTRMTQPLRRPPNVK